MRINFGYQVETSGKTMLVILGAAKDLDSSVASLPQNDRLQIFTHAQVVNKNYYLEGIVGKIIASPAGFTTGLVHSCLPG